ncbi:hypothetical protein DICPUDRAFT_89421 [Dictyostelium purpureum]|uniref:KOW domain-containing protein n=1 Tax=Dictyostelium purpureum TaxID=5786 RepID=F0ZVQ2_DICPU|nr:uncharacterized protein DICPUDRAFT_89421 [Dictyostelium purpureum]EGC31968.1 hypothetical protein DICPUDRAFT_89421 [Dictyostelium purpureum]|eukprot:XP_003291504.1 hypothetical protein DICPUDRAFT_89421 [Dictyostelium purpureum]
MSLFGGKTFKNGIYLIPKWKYIKGDKVEIISGRDKGKQGIIKSVNRKHNNLIVEGLKLIKKHTKPTKTQRQTAFTKEAPIHYSNVSHIDPKYSTPCKVRFQLINGVRERVSRATNTIVQKPDFTQKFKKWRKDNTDGVYDTVPEVANKKTFNGIIDSIFPFKTY